MAELSDPSGIQEQEKLNETVVILGKRSLGQAEIVEELTKEKEEGIKDTQVI